MNELQNKLMRKSDLLRVELDGTDAVVYVRSMTLAERLRLGYGEANLAFGDPYLLSGVEEDLIVSATCNEDGSPLFESQEDRAEARENMDPAIARQLLLAIRTHSVISQETVDADRERVQDSTFPDDSLPVGGELEADAPADS